MSRFTRILPWFAVFVLTCFAYLWFFGLQTFFALQARKIGREVPIVGSVPVEVEDQIVSPAKGEKVSFQGVEFDVPWSDLDDAKTRSVGNCRLVKFLSGNSILLCVGAPGMFMDNMFKNKNAEPELFTRIYGTDVLRSDYALMKAIYRTTPNDIGLFTPSGRAAALSSVIMIKAIAPPTTDSAIYNIRSKSFQGFQLGNPARRPAKMCLQLYADDIEIEISLEQSRTGPTPPVSQADLNRIIRSARKTTPPSTLVTNPG
ncbi:MAG TPA: hypothetical protein VGD60_15115 [Candidatus Acidoferrales bacterium]